jgi:protein-S-isoprenylcysteine O-methyltransferase Ste14
MDTYSRDLPRVVIYPPLIPLGTVVASIFMQLCLPLGLLANLTAHVRLPIGALLLAAGIALIVSGGRTLKSSGTHIAPSLPALLLVSKGTYRWTRNPMYVGGCVALFGATLLFALDWLALILPLSFWILHVGIVKREELYLQSKFGDEYRRYASRVPRYIDPFNLRNRR